MRCPRQSCNMTQTFAHTTVLLQETVDQLQCAPGKCMVDGTLGGGGHAQAILERITPGGRLIGIDRDAQAIAAASERLQRFGQSFTAMRGGYDEISSMLTALKVPGIDGIVLDLGVSSYQLDARERGFSYRGDAPLDMRMDQRQALSAYEVVNDYPVQAIAKVLSRYGEERFAMRVAQAIVRNRPIQTTQQLAEIVKTAIPAATRRSGPHPAKRTFQAIRIEVNDELGALQRLLEALPQWMNKKGRVCIITFHSLEDRLVKRTFATWQNPCTCPPELPRCVCGKVPLGKTIERKGILPSSAEIQENSRARSARLRVFEWTAD